MDRHTLPIILIIGIFASITVYGFLAPGGESGYPEPETYFYTITAEDIEQYHGNVMIPSARITITLDRVLNAPEEICIVADGLGGVVVTIFEKSASYITPRNYPGMEWERGRIWDPGYTARLTNSYNSIHLVKV